MGEFFAVVLAFPAVLFTFMVVVVAAFWLLVLVGGTDVDALDGDEGGEADDGILSGFGLGGVPLTVSLSVLIVIAWFVSLVGTVLLGGLDAAAPVTVTLSIVVLLVAVVAGLLGTRLLVLPLRRLYPDAPEASRMDFLGRTCVVRTGTVGQDFGQAEVTAADGSSAIVQVRQAGTAALTNGSTAVIYDYDAEGEFFWIEPVDNQRKAR